MESCPQFVENLKGDTEYETTLGLCLRRIHHKIRNIAPLLPRTVRTWAMCRSARRCRMGSIWCLPTPPSERITTRLSVKKSCAARFWCFAGSKTDATTAAQIGLAQKYGRIVTDLDGLRVAAEQGELLPC